MTGPPAWLPVISAQNGMTVISDSQQDGIEPVSVLASSFCYTLKGFLVNYPISFGRLVKKEVWQVKKVREKQLEDHVDVCLRGPRGFKDLSLLFFHLLLFLSLPFFA